MPLVVSLEIKIIIIIILQYLYSDKKREEEIDKILSFKQESYYKG